MIQKHLALHAAWCFLHVTLSPALIIFHKYCLFDFDVACCNTGRCLYRFAGLATNITCASPCLLLQPQAAAPASKGFGAPAKKVKNEKTAAQIEREKAASAYDNLAASGIPEYNIFVKVKVSLAGNLLRKPAHLTH
jgi:Family of unknown function (DUF6523)